MKKLMALLKSSLLAAAGVVLPALLLVVLFKKILSLLSSLTAPFAKTLFPNLFATNAHASEIISLIFLAIASIAVGAFAQTGTGKSFGHWLESRTLMHLPLYRGFREFSERLLPSEKGTLFQPALLVREDEMNALVFVVEKIEDQQFVIFIPSSPSAFSGGLYVVPQSDVKILEASTLDVVKTFSRWGVGTSQIIQANSSQSLLQNNESRNSEEDFEDHSPSRNFH